MNFFDDYSTYRIDLPLLAELGLKPFRGKTWQEVFVGKVTLDDALIFLWVTGAPAQFWRFEIVDFGNYQTHTVTTGSGSLSDHWPHVKRIAEGMLGVDSVSFAPEN
jgi:hypothetical protein